MEKTRKSKRKQSSGKNLTEEGESENHQACDRKAESCDMSVEGGMVKQDRQTTQTLRDNKENSTHHTVKHQSRKITLLNKLKYHISPIDILYM